MTKRMKIDGYLIVSLEDQLSPEKAIGELFENALDAESDIINLILTKRSLTIWDNGHGTDDPNEIATPSSSRSRHKAAAIGSKAIGAKQAMATFGRRWDIGSVPRGKNEYHHYVLTWDEDGDLPLQYEGPPLPKHAAPKEIINGGTKIMVTGRRDGFPVIRLDKLCSSLERRYRPCLNSGIKITVRNPEINHARQLQNPALDSGLFASEITERQAIAAGRRFSYRYGALKEDHRILSGCHFIFGPRVIMTESRVGKHALPSACYIDVTLSDQWKKCLATNKDEISRYRDELIEVLESLLGPWIAELKEAAAESKIQVLSGIVSDLLNESVAMLDKNKPGDHRVKPPIKSPDNDDTSKDEEIRVRTKPKTKRRRKSIESGEFDIVKEPHKRCAKLILRPDKNLGRQLFRATFSPKGDEVTILLNSGEHQREIAEHYRLNRIDDLYKVGVMAFGILVAKNPAQFDPVFSGLRRYGYLIDQTDQWEDITSMVSNFMLDALYGRRGSIKRNAA